VLKETKPVLQSKFQLLDKAPFQFAEKQIQQITIATVMPTKISPY
jgi:hypothetical protein